MKETNKQILIVFIIIVLILAFFITTNNSNKKKDDNVNTNKNSQISSSNTFSNKTNTQSTTKNTSINTSSTNSTSRVTTDDNVTFTIRSSLKIEPSEYDLMFYTQEVLKKYIDNPKYSIASRDYTFIKTLLRYKIEGTVNDKKFWMIIEFSNEDYTGFSLISLQVEKEMLYKK